MRVRRGMRPGAGPSPIPGLGRHTGSDGIEFHVMHRGKQMGWFKRAREETILPEMSYAELLTVQFQGVLRVRLT